MKELTYICLVCSLFILLISCSFTPKDSPQSFIGKKLIVDKNWDSTFDSIFLQKELVLVSYVDSNECTPCALERFQYIQANSHKLEESNIATILIFWGSPQKDIMDFLTRYHNAYPIIWDINKTFKTTNHVLNNPVFQDFIIDSTRKIRWIGYPFFDKETWECCKKAIQ